MTNKNERKADGSDRVREVYKVTLAGSVINVALLALKFAAGILGHSAAMIADAIHSLTDFATDVVVLVFVKLGSKPQDEDHDYGHGKYETLATAIIGLSLLVVGLMICYSGVVKTYQAICGVQLQQPGVVALVSVNPLTRAPSRLAAVSKLRRVRVDGSKKRVATTRPSSRWRLGRASNSLAMSSI